MQSKTISKAILPALALISFGISQTVDAKTSIAQNTTLTQEVTAFRNQGPLMFGSIPQNPCSGTEKPFFTNAYSIRYTMRAT